MVKLSASKINTYLSCSWLGHVKYNLKVPDSGSNQGANLGSVTHKILEALIRPDRKRYSKRILEHNDLYCVKSIERLTKIHAKRKDVLDKESLDKISGFVIVALKQDFYHEGAEKVLSEQEFDLKTDKYWIGGYMDKLAFFSDRLILTDYKSSKSKPDKSEFPVQALLYEFYCYKLYPHLKREIEFHYLKFPRACIEKKETSSNELMEGFEDWLIYFSDYLSNFDTKHATASLAASDVTRRWLCGKELGMLNKAGQDAFICAYKYPTIYWEAVKDGKVVKSSRNRSELEYYKGQDCEIVQKEYGGCPAFRHLYERKE